MSDDSGEETGRAPGTTIEQAEDPCPFCLQRYDLVLQVRCVACDRPICPICAIHVRGRREVFCSECDAREG